MSTIAVTNLKHESATGNNIVLDSSGNAAFADGSASAPSITNDGDTNTGIYFPAADNIGFATNGVIRGRWTTDGLCFGSDTAAANALDDYEEGTWTPTIQIAGSSTGITYGTQSGRYTKIGNCVTIWAYIGLSSKGSNSGAVTLTGIPFTYGNISALYTANSMTTKGTATSPLYTYAQSFPNQSYFAIKKQSFDSDVANTDLNNNSEFLFSITYMIT